MRLCETNKCTGCGLCSFICPKKCIKMDQDTEGFYRPLIDEKSCINCGMCFNKCPSNNLPNNESLLKSYLAWHKDKEVLMNSSSGGIFYAIAKATLEQGGMVVGAKYNEDFTVSHDIASNESEVKNFQKSKYMQSDMSMIFNKIENALNLNKVVLFTGTPCQCAAVYNAFLCHHNFNLLYLCDLICHAVQSPKIALDSLHLMEKKYKSKCISIDFRSKDKGWANACNTVVKFKNGKIISKRLNDIPIGITFLKNLSIQKSCENCQYRNFNRISDITIGDFWNMRNDKEFLKKNGDVGFSSIIINTKKGNDLLSLCSKNINLIEKDLVDLKKENNPLWKQFKANPDRDKFFEDYNNLTIQDIQKKYMLPNQKENFIRKIKIIGRKFNLHKLLKIIRKLK